MEHRKVLFILKNFFLFTVTGIYIYIYIYIYTVCVCMYVRISKSYRPGGSNGAARRLATTGQSWFHPGQ